MRRLWERMWCDYKRWRRTLKSPKRRSLETRVHVSANSSCRPKIRLYGIRLQQTTSRRTMAWNIWTNFGRLGFNEWVVRKPPFTLSSQDVLFISETWRRVSWWAAFILQKWMLKIYKWYFEHRNICVYYTITCLGSDLTDVLSKNKILTMTMMVHNARLPPTPSNFNVGLCT